MKDQNSAHVRRRVLALIVGALVLLYAASMAAVHWREKVHLRDDRAGRFHAAWGLYDKAIKDRSAILSALVQTLGQNQRYGELLRRGDRAALYEEALPDFRRLMSSQNISHFYFHRPDRVNFLRVHQPERNGDLIGRVTTKDAARTQALATGLELGPMGTFTLRTVFPLRDGQGVAGYIEIGEDIGFFEEEFRDVLGVESFVLLSKERLARRDWEAGMKMLGRSDDWEQFSDRVEVAASPGISRGVAMAVFDAIRSAAADEYVDVEAEGRRFWAWPVPLKDVANLPVGEIVIVRDITALMAATRKMTAALAAGGLMLGATLFAAMFWTLGQAEREIRDTQDAVATERENAREKAAQLGHIFDQSWDEYYIFDADTLRFIQVSAGARGNLGYAMDELMAMTPYDVKREFTRTSYEAMVAPLRVGQERTLNFETCQFRKDGTSYPVEVRLQFVPGNGHSMFMAAVHDLTERRAHMAELERMALYDELTGLPNKTLLNDRLAHELVAATRSRAPVSLIIANIERMREFNDILGHGKGDRLLLEVARRLREVCRHSDTLGRLGGDEFVFVLPGASTEAARDVAGKIAEHFTRPVSVDDAQLYVPLRFGIATSPMHGESAGDLLRHADIASHLARSRPKAIGIYSRQDNPFSARRLKLLGDLRRAITGDELVMVYQPKVHIGSGDLHSVEALVRWNHPEDGVIGPGEFIPLAEQTGLIGDLTDVVIDKVLKQARGWAGRGHTFKVALNVSARNLGDPEFLDSFGERLRANGVGAERIVVEVTESAVMEHPDWARSALDGLAAMGADISIDDFGTGYSSLAYLKMLPGKELKIDQSFIRALCDNLDDDIIVRSTIAMSHGLGLAVIAEGVECPKVLARLRDLGCDMAQGYLFSRPVSADDLERWIEAGGAREILREAVPA